MLSSETVRSHLKNLYRKLGVRSREEAVEAAGRMRELRLGDARVVRQQGDLDAVADLELGQQP